MTRQIEQFRASIGLTSEEVRPILATVRAPESQTAVVRYAHCASSFTTVLRDIREQASGWAAPSTQASCFLDTAEEGCCLDAAEQGDFGIELSHRTAQPPFHSVQLVPAVGLRLPVSPNGPRHLPQSAGGQGPA